MFEFTVEVRDKTLARVGQILPEDLNLTVNETFNNVGSWTLILANGHPMVPTLRAPGAGIIVTRADAGDVLFSGPVVSPSLEVSAAAPAGTVTISGVSDSVILADRLAYPSPDVADATAQTAANDTRTGTAENLMFAYVDANIGPSAPAERMDARLTLGENGGAGISLTKAPRFQPLGALLSELATVADYPSGTGQPLGFRVLQAGASLQFQTYATGNKSAEVRFDIDNGTLTSSKVATAAPSVTRTIVAGQGDGTARLIEEITSTDSLNAESAWTRRIEQFVDQRQTSDPDQLTAAGNAALAQGGLSQFAMQLTPADDTPWVYGDDYGLGDVVTVVVRDGGADPLAATELSTTVTGYVLKADSSGVRFGALLGQPYSDQLTTFAARLSNLETAGAGSSSGSGSGGAFADLSDVLLTDPSTNDTLTFDGDTGKWINANELNLGSTASTSAVINVARDTLADDALAVQGSGDGNGRFFLAVSGQHRWSDGTNGSDTHLYRSDVATLTTDGDFNVAGNLTGAGAPMQRQTFTANGTWTKPAGAKWVRVVALGGGGGGGGAAAASAGTSTHAGGGQAGSYAESYLAASTFSSTATIVIGAAGAGASTAANGGNGGATTVGGTIVKATGGIGGLTSSASANVYGVQGGSGATTGIGQLATAGAPGGYGFGGPAFGIGGTGGSSTYGAGGVGGAAATANQVAAGSAASGRGAGGGGGAGAATTSTVAAGGAGSGGLVIIDTYF